jgi:hypothetical protein
VRGAGAGIPGSAALGDVTLATEPSSIFGSGVSGLYLPCSSGLLPPPINWRWVEDKVEPACSQVATGEGLLHKTLASVHRNILRLV